VDRNKCSLCFECVKVCPSEALSRAGREFTLEEIIVKVVKYKPFYDTSGGGVTFSGGEPTMHMEFLSELLIALKNKGIHTLIETCGLFNFEKFKEAVLPFTDTIYMDIKLFDANEHKRYCGVDNKTILKNFIKLHELSLSGGFEIVARVPLIPDITDQEENLESIALFLRDHNVKEIRLLPNNPTWHPKCLTIGYESPFGEDSPTRKWLPPEKMEICRNIFRKNSYLNV
jgi:pyruvate formate lyase activating enzyme